jgi:hypothetical protein
MKNTKNTSSAQVLKNRQPEEFDLVILGERGYRMMIGGETDVVKHLNPIFATRDS